MGIPGANCEATVPDSRPLRNATSVSPPLDAFGPWVGSHFSGRAHESTRAPAPAVPAPIRVHTFIDGQNLYHAVQRQFGYANPNYDAVKLSQAITSLLPNRTLVQVPFYAVSVSFDRFESTGPSTTHALTQEPEVKISGGPLRIDGHFVMNPRDAAYASREMFKPKYAIPFHCGTFSLLRGTPAEYQAALGQAPTQVFPISPGDKLTF